MTDDEKKVRIEELRAKCDESGVKYDKRWGAYKLEKALDSVIRYSEPEIQRIKDEVSGRNAAPFEKALEMTTRKNGEAVTASGIILPSEVLALHKKTVWKFILDRTHNSVRVCKSTGNGYTKFVREYSRSVHGDGYAELAERFADKMNRRNVL